jgi:2-iminobutanoate/2-iminopropanoate deaminase
MKEFRNPQDVHEPLGSYSHQIEIKGNERMLVLSGQVGMRQDGSVPGDPLEQIDVAFENIFRNLRAANMM